MTVGNLEWVRAMPVPDAFMETGRGVRGPLMPEHLGWLKAFALAVRGRDFAAGRALCDEAICAFGTVVFRARRLDELEAEQWQIIWNSTRDFDFDYATAEAQVDGGLAVLLTTWRSVGFDAEGKAFERRGRATVVLRQQGGGWLAVHTHFSSEPKT